MRGRMIGARRRSNGVRNELFDLKAPANSCVSVMDFLSSGDVYRPSFEFDVHIFATLNIAATVLLQRASQLTEHRLARDLETFAERKTSSRFQVLCFSDY